MTREQLFLEQLAVIERVIGWVCSRHGLRGADAEDFASAVKTRLIENDYEVLGRFEGRSSLKTYLASVVNRLYLDFQVQRFGKWRPSAEARRLGTVALRL
jgi:DNA-directed RNA polymerase specialized sigma24 family protein